MWCESSSKCFAVPSGDCLWAAVMWDDEVPKECRESDCDDDHCNKCSPSGMETCNFYHDGCIWDGEECAKKTDVPDGCNGDSCDGCDEEKWCVAFGCVWKGAGACVGFIPDPENPIEVVTLNEPSQTQMLRNEVGMMELYYHFSVPVDVSNVAIQVNKPFFFDEYFYVSRGKMPTADDHQFKGERGQIVLSDPCAGSDGDSLADLYVMVTFWSNGCTGHPDTDFPQCDVPTEGIGITVSEVESQGPQDDFVLGLPGPLHGHDGLLYVSLLLPEDYDADNQALRISIPSDNFLSSVGKLDGGVYLSQRLHECPTAHDSIASSFGNVLDFGTPDRVVHIVGEIEGENSEIILGFQTWSILDVSDMLFEVVPRSCDRSCLLCSTQTSCETQGLACTWNTLAAAGPACMQSVCDDTHCGYCDAFNCANLYGDDCQLKEGSQDSICECKEKSEECFSFGDGAVAGKDSDNNDELECSASACDACSDSSMCESLADDCAWNEVEEVCELKKDNDVLYGAGSSIATCWVVVLCLFVGAVNAVLW